MRHIYTLLLYCLMPIALMRLLWKSRRNPAYRHRIGERFAFQLPKAPEEQPLWVHTVSVGEFLAIKPLLIELLSRHPRLKLWITSTTPTGSMQIQSFAHNCPVRVYHSYFPYDTPAILQRFIRHIHPRGIVLMETEIWPNLLTLAHKRNIPVVLINARLSSKSLRGYYKFARRILQEPLQTLMINAQTRDDARRFRTLGAKVERVTVTPNLKYHHNQNELPNWLDDFAQTLARFDFVWLAASTHHGEDDIVINAHKHLQNSKAKTLLILAPRHPERRKEIVALVEDAHFKPKLRSQTAAITASDDIYIIDTLGELNAFFTLSHAAFIGGSLIPHGGHNPLEAIHAGIPVCFGPSMYNFKAIAAELLTYPFATTVEDGQSLSQILLDYADARLDTTINAFNQQHHHVLAQHYNYIRARMPLP